jgi:hypothetical protein
MQAPAQAASPTAGKTVPAKTQAAQLNDGIVKTAKHYAKRHHRKHFAKRLRHRQFAKRHHLHHRAAYALYRKHMVTHGKHHQVHHHRTKQVARSS